MMQGVEVGVLSRGVSAILCLGLLVHGFGGYLSASDGRDYIGSLRVGFIPGYREGSNYLNAEYTDIHNIEALCT